jgi:hypothetical protein
MSQDTKQGPDETVKRKVILGARQEELKRELEGKREQYRVLKEENRTLKMLVSCPPQ